MKTTLMITAIASLLLLASATVWEGVSAAVPSGDLPEVYSVATNSYPKNSVVDITNLENGKTVRVIVVSGLETSGLLAMLSKNAAESIDLHKNSTCRIRMTQPPDEIAFSRFRLGPIESDSASKPAVDKTVIDKTIIDKPAAEKSVADILVADELPEVTQAPEQPSEPVTGVTYATFDSLAAETVAAGDAGEELTADTAGADVTAAQVQEPGIISGTLALVPAKERIPEAPDQFVIAPEYLAPPLRPIAATPPINAADPASDFSPFEAPLINKMEQGMCYVQIAVYTRPDNVEDEILRIGKGYPVAIQNIGNDTSPLFRVLLGPLNQGESAAMLQRFKSIGYDDAFVRQN